jgi:hypothetical protein
MYTNSIRGNDGIEERAKRKNLFKEMSEDKAFDVFLETPYIFAFAGLATPPGLNNNNKYGIRAWAELSYVKTIISQYVRAEMTYKEVSTELEKMGYTTKIKDSSYKPEDSVDFRWVKLDHAIERVKKIISVYEHKASQSSFYCYADMADALRLLYEKERTACRSYI